MSYGELTVPTIDKKGVRKIKIDNYVRANFSDGRKVVLMELEDETMFLQIENAESSGRNPNNQLWLSKDSFAALQAIGMLHNQCTGTDPDAILASVVDGETLDFEFSPNLSVGFV